MIDDLIDFTDFLPTLADAAALTIPEDVALDGVSFWERLQGKAGHPREWIYTYYFPWPYAYTYNSPAQHPKLRTPETSGTSYIARESSLTYPKTVTRFIRCRVTTKTLLKPAPDCKWRFTQCRRQVRRFAGPS